MSSMDPDPPTVTVELWRADPVVLFDWLMTTELNTVPISHPAQKQALADLLDRLEHETDILPLTHQEVAAAQRDVSKDMGW